MKIKNVYIFISFYHNLTLFVNSFLLYIHKLLPENFFEYLLTNMSICCIIKARKNSPYQEWWRNRSCEARQPNCEISRKVLIPAVYPKDEDFY